MGIFGLPWLWLLRSGIQARQRQAHMEIRAADFFTPLATHPLNQSAESFDTLAADLGFPPNIYSNPAIRVDTAAGQAYLKIQEPLEQFFQTQTTKVSGSLEAPPAELQAYLSRYAEPITAVQTHVLGQAAPQWDMTLEQMFDPNYPFPGFVNVRNVQRLLLLSALDYNARGQQVEMLAALEASWQLNQALLQRPDLVSKILVSVVAEHQAGLLRHLDNVPEIWQTRLAFQAQQQSVLSGLQFDTWLQYKASQQSLTAALYRSNSLESPQEKLMGALSYWFSPSYILQLRGIDYTQTVNRALAALAPLEVCSTTQRAAEQRVEQEMTATWNQGKQVATEIIARRWKIAGDRALSLELTQQVLHAKQHHAETGQWPEPSARIHSETCSEEFWSWAYDKRPLALQETNSDRNETNRKGGILTLSLSAEPLPTTHPPTLQPGPPIPLSYQLPVN